MYCGRDFDPADPDETDVFSFDFVNDLAPGEVLQSTTWSIAVIVGSDPNASTRFQGSPAINPSPTTGLITISSQRVGSLVNGCTYAVKADVNTNAGNTKSLWSRIPCASAPNIA